MKRLSTFLFAAACTVAMPASAQTTSTTSPLPALARPTASSVTANSAVLSTMLMTVPEATSVRLQFANNSSMTNATLVAQQVVNPQPTAAAVNAALRYLAAGTTYYAQATASNSHGTTQTSVIAFTTAGALPPAVVDASSSSVSSTMALLSAVIDGHNMPANAWFQYGTDATLASAVQTAVQSVPAMTTAVNANGSVSGLLPATTYYYRAFAENAYGRSAGAIKSFATAASSAPTGLPTLNRPSVSSVTSSSAVLSAVLSSVPETTTVRLLLSRSSTMASATTVRQRSIAPQPTGTSVNVALSALLPATVYYCQASATNSKGTTLSDIVAFTTAP